MSGRYEPVRYVAVPRLLNRNGKFNGKWHKIAKELKPGHAIHVEGFNESKMLYRAARQLGMEPSVAQDKEQGGYWVGVPSDK